MLSKYDQAPEAQEVALGELGWAAASSLCGALSTGAVLASRWTALAVGAAGAAVTLAIAGNALKAFPGLGTVGGGLVHAVAYGLVFDSLGRAVAATLAQARRLDREATLAAFEQELQRPSRERLALVMEIAREALLGLLRQSAGKQVDELNARGVPGPEGGL